MAASQVLIIFALACLFLMPISASEETSSMLTEDFSIQTLIINGVNGFIDFMVQSIASIF
ncbi:unnamed protein product [Larinioides sclopetarius]|uniref:Uncharacterized protein n=1 Tax=Larinioides sclopetarius TaxID=280406 RepID=A0AAV2BUK4_9ARAC